MPLKLTERDVTRQIRDFLEWRQWRALRQQRTVIPGAFQTGEPGIPDFLFLRYLPDGMALALWVEMKAPGRKTAERQQQWRAREEKRGAVVVTVDDLGAFQSWYDEQYGWLHGPEGIGQMDLRFVRRAQREANR